MKLWSRYQQEFVPHGIDDYFDVAICMDDAVKHKPDPAPLLKYMEKTGVGGYSGYFRDKIDGNGGMLCIS